MVTNTQMATGTRQFRFVVPTLRVVGVALAAVFVCGCRSEMYNQPRYEPLEASEFFRDGKSARPLEPGTVARIDARNEPRDIVYAADRLAGGESLFATGKIDGKPADVFPFPIDREALARGQQRYRIFCTPCHGELGDGRGMIVQRGFSPPPPFYGPLPKTGATPVSIYSDLRDAPVGHFVDVMTNGHGAMYSYASRIPPSDRWRIAAYIRALQLSQHATTADLRAIRNPTPSERQLLKEAAE
jgi:mono/diheme cytochrome c family protein